MNIVKIIQQESKKYLNHVALRDTVSILTYEQLFENVKDIVQKLRNDEIKNHARIALLCPEGVDYIILVLAILSLDAVAVPIHLNSSKKEIKRVIDEMKIEYFIFEETLFHSNVENAPFSIFYKKHSFVIQHLNGKLAEQNEFESLNPAFIRFSSGTTGKSKGVVISHESILERTDTADQVLKISSQDVILWVLSMSCHFVVTILLFLRRGATLVLCEQSIPQGLVAGLSQQEVTFIYAAPIHYQAMVRSVNINPNICSQVRMAVSTAVSLNEQVAKEFREKFGLEVSAAYGIIEIGLPFINHSGNPEFRLSVGEILPGYEIYIEDKDVKGIGSVYLKGPGMFDAYFSPWQTRNQVLKEGWFKTGDLGRIDENGYLYLYGRLDQVINFMGMKIFAEEVKQVLESFPDVQEAFVYGEPHDSFGQIPKARIVLESTKLKLNIDGLRRFCYEILASYKVPKDFECVASLKKTMNDKVMIAQ
ncbi:MAG: acyl--CoA ligase [Candidatus Scalindua sp.]|nr:acyl--CoA ligase [Candidatus Scalindua sp.]MCR4344675.1 acyl--CoA ligase [Candidatus Scalindua sp.]